MEQNQIDIEKIKLELSRMSDDYWEDVTNRGTVLTTQAAKIIGDIKDAFNKLAIIRMNTLETKRSGYQRLVENKKKTATAKIVSENKERIEQLRLEKQQSVIELSTLINNLTSLIKEVQTIGTISPANGGDKIG